MYFVCGCVYVQLTRDQHSTHNNIVTIQCCLLVVEQLTDLPVAQELAKANPARLIPTLDDDGFCLFES